MTPGTAGRLRSVVPVISTEEQLADLVEYYLRQDGFAFDVESQGDDRLNPLTNDVAWISLATHGRADAIPMRHRNGELLEYRAPVLASGLARLAEGKSLRASDVSRADSRLRPVFSDPPEQLARTLVYKALEPLFSSDTLIKVAHNFKFDAVSGEKFLGFIPASPFVDTMVVESLIDSRIQKQHLKLEACVKRRLGYEMEKGVGKDITLYGFNQTAKYSKLDSKMTWLLYQRQMELVRALGIEHLLNLEMDVMRPIIEMQMTGTRVDRGAMLVFQAEINDVLDQAKKRAYAKAGREFAFSKAADKIDVLYSPKPQGQGLKPAKYTAKTNQPSTDADSLEHHSRNPLVKAMLEVAEYQRLVDGYLTPYLDGKDKVAPKIVNGRVHTTFNQVGAETGRMSSSNPNLQNIPSRGQFGKRIRGFFIADPDTLLVVGDFSQIEPRIIASLSQDPVMLAAYLAGRDLYQEIADTLSITRAAGKELVLSMSYGIGPDKLSDRIDGVTLSKAKELLDDFDHRFPAVNQLKERTVRRARAQRPTPSVTTLAGRTRYIPELKSRDNGVFQQGRRKAFNTLIQGSAADIMKIAIVRAYERVPDGARLLLTVHDELVIQAPKELAEETAAALKDAMEGISIPAITVPLVAEVGIGRSWAEAK